MKYKLVIFDWQGTLTDVIGQFVKQFFDSAKLIGLPDVDESKLRSLMHLDICYLIQTLYPESVYSSKRSAMFNYFIDYRMHHGHDVCVFPGAKQLIMRLIENNVFIGIATAASLITLKEEVAYAGLTELIDACKTPDHTLGKPAPDMLNELMAEFDCEPKETVMIGDSRCDFEAAQHAKVDFIGLHIRSDALTRDVLNHQSCVACDVSALLPLLN